MIKAPQQPRSVRERRRDFCTDPLTHDTGGKRMKVRRRKERTANVGIFGVGYDMYWAQFGGLLDELMGYLEVFEKQVRGCGGPASSGC